MLVFQQLLELMSEASLEGGAQALPMTLRGTTDEEDARRCFGDHLRGYQQLRDDQWRYA